MLVLGLELHVGFMGRSSMIAHGRKRRHFRAKGHERMEDKVAVRDCDNLGRLSGREGGCYCRESRRLAAISVVGEGVPRRPSGVVGLSS